MFKCRRRPGKEARLVRMHATPTPHTYYTHTWTQRSYVPLMRKSVQHGTDAFQIFKDFQGHKILASVVCIYALHGLKQVLRIDNGQKWHTHFARDTVTLITYLSALFSLSPDPTGYFGADADFLYLFIGKLTISLLPRETTTLVKRTCHEIYLLLVFFAGSFTHECSDFLSYQTSMTLIWEFYINRF